MLSRGCRRLARLAVMMLGGPVVFLHAEETTANHARRHIIEGASPEVRIISHGPGMCNNIYGEVPYMDASSRYVIYMKLGERGDQTTGDVRMGRAGSLSSRGLGHRQGDEWWEVSRAREGPCTI